MTTFVPPSTTQHLIFACIQEVLHRITTGACSQPRAARALALAAGAIDGALEAADWARSRGRLVCERAAITGAVSVIIEGCLPPAPNRHTPSALVEIPDIADPAASNGWSIGRCAAHALLAWARSDGSLATAKPVGSPRDASGIEPRWGQVRPMVVRSGASMRCAAPPRWDSAAFSSARAAFWAAQTRYDTSAQEQRIAREWDLGCGTLTLAGAWFRSACELALRAELTPRMTSRMLASLGATLHDTMIACWDSKYHFQVARPTTWMQQRHPSWAPLVATPAHPAYPSAHAALSSAAEVVLSAWFPGEMHALRRSACTVARSRVVAGVQWALSVHAGQLQGRLVAAAVLAAMGCGVPEVAG